MTSIYDFKDFRKFILKIWEDSPNKGHGQSRRLAEYTQVHTTLISQIFSGAKSFSMEQAVLAAEFLGLSESESDYFLLLVQYDRAGSKKLKEKLEKQIHQHQEKAKVFINRIQSTKVLTEEQKALFYADWVCSAIRQLTALKGFDTPEQISAYLGVPIKRTRESVQFLLEAGLCIEEKGKLKIGPQSTHLRPDSPWVRTHHANWRQKSLEKLSGDEPSKLHYTAPMTLSAQDAYKIRKMLIDFLGQVDQVIDPSPSEELHCLNIDWFKL